MASKKNYPAQCMTPEAREALATETARTPAAERDWTAYNATVPGAVYPNAQPSHAYAPGLEATQGPNARPTPYRAVSFGAKREWENDEDGWTHVGSTKKARRSWKGSAPTERTSSP